MSEITAIRAGKGRQRRVNLFLDGRFALSVDAEVAARAQLKTGQELTGSQINALHRSDRSQRCFNAALRFLSYRPRSEHEMRERLRQRGFDRRDIETTLARLKEQSLIDDTAFARLWKDNRQTLSPRSQRLTRLELSRKGIAADTIKEAVGDIDDRESAYQAALNRAQRLSRLEYNDFRRRLASFLRGRGFDFKVINHTVERLWRESAGNNPQ